MPKNVRRLLSSIIVDLYGDKSTREPTEVAKVKPFAEYNSLEEILRDASAEGLITITFSKPKRVRQWKVFNPHELLEFIQNNPGAHRTKVGRKFRQPVVTLEKALQSLVDSGKIYQERSRRRRRGRRFVAYFPR